MGWWLNVKIWTYSGTGCPGFLHKCCCKGLMLLLVLQKLLVVNVFLFLCWDCLQVRPASSASYSSTEIRRRYGLVFSVAAASRRWEAENAGHFYCRVVSRRRIFSAVGIFADFRTAGCMLSRCVETPDNWWSLAHCYARLKAAAPQPALHHRLEKDHRVDWLCSISVREASASALHGVSQTSSTWLSFGTARICWR